MVKLKVWHFFSISVRPLIAYSNPNIDVIQGRSVQLSCIVLLGNPQPKVMWFRMGEQVIPDDRILSDGMGSLLITSAEPIDEGEYTCVASNVGGNATYVTKVDVQGMYHYYRLSLIFKITLEVGINCCKIASENDFF
jgi:hypothetical protein